mgnify:CR=1 FL=1
MPTMTLDALKTRTNGRDANIAYKTRAVWHTDKGGTIVSIEHHGNVIAVISPNILIVTGAGWNSVTTANRLRKILRDNNIGCHVFVKDGLMRIRYDNVDYYLSHNAAHFARDEHGQWGQMHIIDNVR